MTLPTLERASLAERAAAVITQRIVAGDYAGGRLPSEKVLAAELGVTRLTLREALSRLAAKGLIETRHGSGTRVCSEREPQTLELVGDLMSAGLVLDAEDVASLLEFRELVFGAFSSKMAEGIDEERIAELRALLERAAAATTAAERAQVDYAFDAALAAATGNRFLRSLLRSMRELHVRLGALVHRLHGDDGEILETQRALVDALERGRSRKAKTVLATYLEGARDALAHLRPEDLEG